MTERDIFFSALDLPDPADRSAFVEKACADAVLRGRVIALLRSHTTAGPFLETPAVTPPRPESVSTPTADVTGGYDGDAEREACSFLAPPTRPEALGRLGHYEVREVLGRGGFGTVYRATDDLLERVVAIKAFAPTAGVHSAAHKRFLREARSSARVRHENVVQVYDVVERPVPYLVMEYVAGETLQQRLDRTGPLPVADAVRVGREIAEGLAAAHAHDLVHRDVKPGNVLLEGGPTGRVKLTDFGLARTVDDVGLTQSGVLAGTPLYMAPEVAKGEPFDHRADLFSLGSVLYAMAAGHPPFQAATTFGVLKRVVETEPRPLREVNPAVPAWLGEIISRLHAKNPDERFATAREVADLLGGGEAAAVPPPQPAARPRFTARHWAAVAALVAVVGLGATEAFGVTAVRGTIIRLLTPEGTLVVEVDDPDVAVTIDGLDLAITGAGVKEVKLKTGRHTVKAVKDGKVLREELVNVTRNGKQIVRVSREPVPAAPDAAAWERAVSVLPAVDQVKAVAARLRQLNPGFDGTVVSSVQDGVVRGLEFQADRITDISPVRVLTGLTALTCAGSDAFENQAIQETNGKVRIRAVGKSDLSDLSPLKGLPLTSLKCFNSKVSDLTPLAGMKLSALNVACTPAADLAPLARMPLTDLSVAYTKVAGLAPLAGMKFTVFHAEESEVADLTPLKGMPIQLLSVGRNVTDLTPLKGMPIREFTAYRAERLSDLTPLSGMPLKIVNCQHTRVSALAALKGTPVEYLIVSDTPVADLSPLREMAALKSLNMARCRVTDLSPLKGLALERIETNTFRAERDAPILRAIPTLKEIDHKPAAEFWKGLEKKK